MPITTNHRTVGVKGGFFSEGHFTQLSKNVLNHLFKSLSSTFQLKSSSSENIKECDLAHSFEDWTKLKICSEIMPHLFKWIVGKILCVMQSYLPQVL